MLDDSNMRQIAALERNCDEVVSTDLTQASDVCGMTMGYIREVSANVLSYDARIFSYDFDPIEAVVV